MMGQLFICKRCMKSKQVLGTKTRYLPMSGRSRVCKDCAAEMVRIAEKATERIIDESIAKKQGRDNGT